jgi:hypothetical protein
MFDHASYLCQEISQQRLQKEYAMSCITICCNDSTTTLGEESIGSCGRACCCCCCCFLLVDQARFWRGQRKLSKAYPSSNHRQRQVESWYILSVKQTCHIWHRNWCSTTTAPFAPSEKERDWAVIEKGCYWLTQGRLLRYLYALGTLNGQRRQWRTNRYPFSTRRYSRHRLQQHHLRTYSIRTRFRLLSITRSPTERCGRSFVSCRR